MVNRNCRNDSLPKAKPKFHVILIKPSKYDDAGYVIRWLVGIVPSNTLACLYALSEHVRHSAGFGAEVDIVIHCFDESVQRIPVRSLSRNIARRGERAVACMVGVQTNQFARAADLSKEFIREGVAAMIGGFHVSGVIEMLPDHTPEIKQVIQDGITLVAGEVENRWEELLRAAYEGGLKPVYDFVADKPSLSGAPGPILPVRNRRLFLKRQTSFDAGRGCPFTCSFCTIINIQGNMRRGRTVDDIEKVVRRSYETGRGNSFFITDDNFARHPEWEQIADRLIELKEKENIRCSLMIQTDALAHKIPRFIEKMTLAGCRRVFIGLESVNPDNLIGAGKRQNRLDEYRRMLQKWRDHNAITCAGYIIGFPGDTYESIMRDVEYLKRELPLDLAEFFIMTPVPGSKDHQKYYLEGVPLERDTNLYDTWHVCMKHPRMTNDELMRAYRDVWKSFYSKEHIRTLLLRRKGSRRRLLFASIFWFCSTIFIYDLHPLIGGFVRRKGRRDRRPGLKREPFAIYYLKRAFEMLVEGIKLLKLAWEIWHINKWASRPENQGYTDRAIRPEEDDEKKEIEPSLVAFQISKKAPTAG